ncbi:dynein axonemal heavy chain 10-like isoform X1 [Oscarella lobularis]|uniref:dynein axonemal heavy chain 10-like isoform X1 n=1 Tax=Oscarella lobularis TaxID=121494 RepID=UPI0033144E6D
MNFAVELQHVTTEAKYLEQLGFQIPELARNVALQEDKYVTYVDGLKRTLERYDETLAFFNAPEAELLGDHVRELQRVLKPGAKRLNWSSLGDYITRCHLTITKMESLVNQIHKNAHDIELLLKLLEQADLFRAQPLGPGGRPLEAKEYFDCIDTNRNSVIGILARKYHAIGPLLTEVKGLVVNTNTSRSSRLKPYYLYSSPHSRRWLIYKNLELFSRAYAAMRPSSPSTPFSRQPKSSRRHL